MTKPKPAGEKLTPAQAGALGVKARKENQARRAAGEVIDIKNNRKRPRAGSDVGSTGSNVPQSPYAPTIPSPLAKKTKTEKAKKQKVDEPKELNMEKHSDASDSENLNSMANPYKLSDALPEQKKAEYIPRHLPGLLPSRVVLPVVLRSKGSTLTLTNNRPTKGDFKTFWGVVKDRVVEMSKTGTDKAFGTMLTNQQTDSSLKLYAEVFPTLLSRSASLSYNSIPTKQRHIADQTFRLFLSRVVDNAKTMQLEIKNEHIPGAHRSQEQAPAEITARLISLATGTTYSTITQDEHSKQLRAVIAYYNDTAEAIRRELCTYGIAVGALADQAVRDRCSAQVIGEWIFENLAPSNQTGEARETIKPEPKSASGSIFESKEARETTKPDPKSASGSIPKSLFDFEDELGPNDLEQEFAASGPIDLEQEFAASGPDSYSFDMDAEGSPQPETTQTKETAQPETARGASTTSSLPGLFISAVLDDENAHRCRCITCEPTVNESMRQQIMLELRPKEIQAIEEKEKQEIVAEYRLKHEKQIQEDARITVNKEARERLKDKAARNERRSFEDSVKKELTDTITAKVNAEFEARVAQATQARLDAMVRMAQGNPS